MNAQTNCPLPTLNYLSQEPTWPTDGRHILAHFDANTVVVYQAYKQSIAEHACTHGHFGRDFKLDRMTWIKPNFLWMMYRSGWGSKAGQEHVLAIRLKRAAFDEILNAAVFSTFDPERHGSQEHWQNAISTSEVRLQWDPDHLPDGNKSTRRAIQLGLRGSFASKYAGEWIVEISDISDFVHAQAHHARPPYADLMTPVEHIYPVEDAAIRTAIGLDE